MSGRHSSSVVIGDPSKASKKTETHATATALKGLNWFWNHPLRAGTRSGCPEGMTFSISFKPMTKVFNAPGTASMARTAATGIALALAPLVAVIGIASVLAPAADARIVCQPIGNAVVCR